MLHVIPSTKAVPLMNTTDYSAPPYSEDTTIHRILDTNFSFHSQFVVQDAVV
jgi:hypothetical protein